ncbi:MAG: tetratricopeptide repeat protein [Planctomycetota bacterium]
MSGASGDIFLSCVSREFHRARPDDPTSEPSCGSYRTLLDKQLKMRGADADFQEQFVDGPSSTLELLDEKIQRCKAVVHLIGDATGACPTADEVSVLRQKYPTLLDARTELRAALDAAGWENISYTQWEAYLALHHGKHLVRHRATAAAPRTPGFTADLAEAERQQAHLDRLAQIAAVYASEFSDPNKLCLDVITELGAAGKIAEARLGILQNLLHQSIGQIFKGRGGLMDELSDRLGTGQPVALYGTGGVGKTRAAIEFAWRYQNDYDALLFVSAEPGPTDDASVIDPAVHLQSQLADLNGVLKLADDTAKQADKLKEVLNWLNRDDTRWLMVIDNVDRSETRHALFNGLLNQLVGGQVVLTTRLAEWQDFVETVPVEILTMQAAVDLLLDTHGSHRIRTPNEEDEAKTVAEAMGYLSSGLYLARAFVSHRYTDYAAYLRRFQANDAKVTQWPNAYKGAYQHELLTAWQTSVDELGEEAKLLLDVLAWYAADPIPMSMTEKVPDDLAERLSEVRDALAELAEFCLADIPSDGETFTVPRLIQEVTRRRQGVGEDTPTPDGDPLDLALRWINEQFTGDPEHPDNWPRLGDLAPHATEAAMARGTPREPAMLLLNQLDCLADAQGDYAVAEPLSRRAVEARERVFGPEHPNTLASVNNLAGLLESQGDLSSAEPLYRRALEARERVLGPEHPGTLTSVNNLAGLLESQGDLSSAEPLYRRCVVGLVQLSRSVGRAFPNLQAGCNNWIGCMLAMEFDRKEISRRLHDAGVFEFLGSE